MKTHHIWVLIAVNIVIGGIALVLFVLLFPVKDIPDNAIIFAVFLQPRGKGATSLFVNFVLGMLFTIVAELLSSMIIRRLKKEMHNIILPDTTYQYSVGVSNTKIQKVDKTRHSTKICQKKAMLTICVIVVFFNITILSNCKVFAAIYGGLFLNLMTTLF